MVTLSKSSVLAGIRAGDGASVIGAMHLRSGRQSATKLRLAHVAAETGARFVRERIDVSPIGWMLRRLDLFDGHSAIDCCSSSDGYRRAMLLHGLSLGLDAKPQHVDCIPDPALVLGADTVMRDQFPPLEVDRERWGGGRLALFTCTIAASLHDGEVQVFCAMIARSEAEVRFRLRQRYGRVLEDEAKVRRGFDESEPLACSLVSEAIADLLKLVAQHPTSDLARGLDFQVEQRFAS